MECDPACTNCCEAWQIRAQCGGNVGTRGAYRAYVEARRGADEANATARSCSPADASCAEVRLSCSSAPNGVAPWEPTCVGASWSPGLLAAITQTFDAGDRALADAGGRAAREMDALTLFVVRPLTAKGQKAIGGVAAQLRAAADKVSGARRDGQLLRVAGGASASAVSAWQNQQAAAVQEADAALAAVETVMNDPASIDAIAEEQLRRRREAAEQARRALADASAAAQARIEAAAQQKARAEAEEKTRQQAADQRLTAASLTIGDQRRKVGAALLALTGLLARPDITPGQRASALALQRQLTRELDALKAIEGRAVVAPGSPSVVVGARASEVEGGLRAIGQQAAVSLAAAGALADVAAVAPAVAPAPAMAPAPPPPAAPAPSRPPVTSVPTCVVQFAAAPGAVAFTLAVDGASPVPLPADVKIASGRHTLVVRAGGVQRRSSELLVCGRVRNLVLEPPK
jgi:hypothetical protein